jgi:predicted metalloprotease with PDZ domain
MAKQIVVTTEPEFLESIAAETKLVVNQQSALVRGWQSITPEVIAASRAADEARTNALTAYYLNKFNP